ncbi:MAG: hypothetical protein ACO1RX_13675 [Candidatus Sericytochromatia bacterium]
MKIKAFCCALMLFGLGLPARAHHEIIFGPQSSTMLTADRYISLQAFSRQTGSDRERTQESNALLSFGFNPVPEVPFGFTVIAPSALISPLDGQGGGKSGIEDIILAARYRYDLTELQSLWGKEGNFILGMTGLEIPNGAIDYEPFQGTLDTLGALMLSLEYGPFSGISYAYYRHSPTDFAGNKSGDNLFLGGGLAYTPIDEDMLLSFQLGFSYENYYRNATGGEMDPMSGGRGLILHPTVVYSPGYGLQFFGVFSLPIWQAYANPLDQDRFRIGTGVVYMF